MRSTLLLLVAIALSVAGCRPSGPAPDPVTSQPSTSLPLSPKKSTCSGLCQGRKDPRPGDVVTVRYEPAKDAVWGVAGELWRIGDRSKRIAFVTSSPTSRRMTTVWRLKGAFIDIGYGGSARWKWRVPARLTAGVYELRKWSDKGDSRVRFTVG